MLNARHERKREIGEGVVASIPISIIESPSRKTPNAIFDRMRAAASGANHWH